jgi:hypothetical protein
VAHGELDVSVRQLAPILDDRHVTALRKPFNNFASLQAGLHKWKDKRLSQNFFIPVSSARHSVCKIAGAIVHKTTPTKKRSIQARSILVNADDFKISLSVKAGIGLIDNCNFAADELAISVFVLVTVINFAIEN